MKKGIRIWLAALMLGVACEDGTGPETMTAVEVLQAAFLREMFGLEPWTGAAAYCVSTGSWTDRQDPPAAVLAQFRGHTPPVVAASGCVSDLNATMYNGALARSYHIEMLELDGDDAVIEGFYRQHVLDAAGYRCRAARRGGQWLISRCEMLWIA